MRKKITLPDIKQALLDEQFRKILPSSLDEDIAKFLANPGCGCNHSIYKKVIASASEQLLSYYPVKSVVDAEELQYRPINYL